MSAKYPTYPRRNISNLIKKNIYICPGAENGLNFYFEHSGSQKIGNAGAGGKRKLIFNGKLFMKLNGKLGTESH